MLKVLTNPILSLRTTVLNSQQTRSMRLRKPPWVPRAKNKLFKVPTLKEHDQDEYKYMKPIWDRYKAEMRSMYLLFKTEGKFSDKESVKAQEEKRKLLAKETKLLEENDRVNAEILKIQLAEENVKLETKKKQAELELKKHNKLEELYVRKADQMIRKLVEKSKTFIDPNNLEYEIEKALNERFDHNFSIDSSGRFFKSNTLCTKSQAFDPKFVPPVKKLTEQAHIPSSEETQTNPTV